MNTQKCVGWNMEGTVFTLPPLGQVYPFKESYTRAELLAMPPIRFETLAEVLRHVR